MQAKKISRKVSVTDQISAAWDLNGLKLSPDLLWSSGSANHWRNKTEVSARGRGGEKRDHDLVSTIVLIF